MEEPTASSVREIKSDAVDKSTVRGPSYLVAVFPLLLLASTAGAFPAIVDYIDLHGWKMAEGFVDSFIAPMIFALFFVFIQSTLSCRHWSFQSLVSSCLLMTTVVVLVLYGWILRYDRFDALLLAMSLLAVLLLGVVKIASNYFMRRWPRFSQRCAWYPLESEGGAYSSWVLIAISLAVVAWLATGIARVILSDSAGKFIGGPLNFSTNAVSSATGRYLLIGSLVFAYLIGVDHAVRSWLFPYRYARWRRWLSTIPIVLASVFVVLFSLLNSNSTDPSNAWQAGALMVTPIVVITLHWTWTRFFATRVTRGLAALRSRGRIKPSVLPIGRPVIAHTLVILAIAGVFEATHARIDFDVKTVETIENPERLLSMLQRVDSEDAVFIWLQLQSIADERYGSDFAGTAFEGEIREVAKATLEDHSTAKELRELAIFLAFPNDPPGTIQLVDAYTSYVLAPSESLGSTLRSIFDSSNSERELRSALLVAGNSERQIQDRLDRFRDDPRVAAKLVAMIESENRWQQRVAFILLWRRPESPETQSGLRRLLTCRDEGLRVQAASRLLLIGDAESVETITSAIRSRTNRSAWSMTIVVGCVGYMEKQSAQGREQVMRLLIDELLGLFFRELETRQTGYDSQGAVSMLCRSLQSSDVSWDELRSADPRVTEVIMFWLAGPEGWQNTPTIGDLIRRGLIEIDDLQECRTDALSTVGRERFEKALNQLQAIADMTRNE